MRTAVPGLQAQRTALAWGRTGLAVIVNALLVLRVGLNAADRPVQLLGIGFLALAGGILVMADARRRQLAAMPTGARPRALAACAACVVLVSAGGAAALLR